MRSILGLLALIVALFNGCTTGTQASRPDARGQTPTERSVEGGGGGGSY